MKQNWRKVALFISLAFFTSWFLALVFFISGLQWGTPASLVLAVAYMFGPMTATIIVQKLVYKEPLREPLGISFRINRWFLVAWFLPPITGFCYYGCQFASTQRPVFSRHGRIFQAVRSGAYT